MSEPEQNENNVVALFAGSDVAIRLSEKPKAHCRSDCKSIHVDPQNRAITCAECGAVLDPFDYLWMWAKKGDHRLSWLKSLEIEEKKLRVRIEVLKKEAAKYRRHLREAMPKHPYLANPYALEHACTLHVVNKPN